MKIRCITVDDEPRALEIIEDYISQVPFLEHAASFRNPIKSLEYLKTHPVDLVFLDINMPFLSGIQLIRTLKNKPLFILTTAYAEYAVESYNLDVLYYLLKPIEFEVFMRAVNKAFHQLFIETQNDNQTTSAFSKKSIFVKDGNQLVKVDLKDIYYIEGTGNYQTIQLMDRKVLTLISMNELLTNISKPQFIRVHKSFAVNIEKIISVEHHRIKIADKLIPIGASYKEVFYRTLQSRH